MDDRQFRNAMGKFATGVTVIATEVEGEGVHGMTANAFMSVSLDPKLVVISIGEKAKILNKIKESKMFTVNILAADQQEVSMIFAGQLKEHVKSSLIALMENRYYLVQLHKLLVKFQLNMLKVTIRLFIGKVTDIHLEDAEPLDFL